MAYQDDPRPEPATKVPAYDLGTGPCMVCLLKTARIYAELAEYARSRGYPAATEHGIKDWRGRGMLPSGRGLGRSRRRPGRIPLPLRQRVDRICHYHYRLGVRDLRMVTLLLWLDGEDLDLKVVRAALATVRTLPERLVKLVGHTAKRAEPEAPDADIDATADAVARALSRLPEARLLAGDDLANAAGDALRISTGRGESEDPSDLASLATAIGLDRAHSDTVAGVGPWLETEPASAFGEALLGLYGPGASERLSATCDDELLRARSTANRLIRVFTAYSEISFGFAPGTAGLDLLAQLATEPVYHPLLLYLAILLPAGASDLVEARSDEELANWHVAAELGRAWLEANPEHRDDARARGLFAVLQDLGFE